VKDGGSGEVRWRAEIEWEEKGGVGGKGGEEGYGREREREREREEGSWEGKQQ
jgi:hypothetical protein